MTYLRHLWTAFESGWRAGKKQARKRWTELRKPAASKPAPMPMFPDLTP